MSDNNADAVIVAFRSPSRRRGFSQVPNVVLLDKTLSDGAKVLYAVLVSYAMQTSSFKVNQEAIGEDVGKKERMVRLLLKELSGRGLITIHRQGVMLPNIYFIEDAYALYDSEQPKLSKSVRTEKGPAKNYRSPDRQINAGHSGNSVPVISGKKLPPLNKNSGKDKKKEPEVSPSALEKTEDQKAVYKQGAARLMAALEAAEKGRKP